MSSGDSLTVLLSSTGRDRLLFEARKHEPLETGGVLLGCRLQERTLLVYDATGPGPRAHHANDSFIYDADYCQRLLHAVFTASHGLITYLGDWHSHPGGALRPSRKDERALRSIALDKDARCPRPLLLLTDGSRIESWLYDRQLEQVELVAI